MHFLLLTDSYVKLAADFAGRASQLEIMYCFYVKYRNATLDVTKSDDVLAARVLHMVCIRINV